MTRRTALAAILVLGLAGLAFWAAQNTSRTGTAAGSGDVAGSAYDYEARDVVIRQMSADGTLQYEVEAKQIAQLPHNGQISASDVIMRYDPPGSAPDGKNRWTLSADQLELPDDGSRVALNGKVRAQGVPVNSSAMVLLTTERLDYSLATQELSTVAPAIFTWAKTNTLTTDHLTYNLTTQDVTSPSLVVYSWGRNNTLKGRGLRANIKTGDVALQSEADVTLKP